MQARSLRTPFLFISCKRMSMSNFLQCWMYSWLPSACLLWGQSQHADLQPLPSPRNALKFNPGCSVPTPRSQAGAWPGPLCLHRVIHGTTSLVLETCRIALGNLKNKLLFSLLPLHPPKSRAQPSQHNGARSRRGGARRARTCLLMRGKRNVDPGSWRMLWG